MKKSVYITFLSILSIIFSGCSVYEDIYFNEDGTISYSLTYDASQILAMTPDALGKNSDIPADSIITISEILKEKKDSIQNMSDEEREMFEALKPFSLSIKNDSIARELSISVKGDFENSETMNHSFLMLNKISKEKEGGEDNLLRSNSKFDINYSLSRYSWDGKKMTRTIDEKGSLEEPDEDSKRYREMMMLFSGGKIMTRYHFPNRIKSISNEKALFSQDGKSVVLEQPAASHIKPTAEAFDIVIETE